MSRQAPYDDPAIHPGELCESCKRAPATQLLARREGQIRAARLVREPIAPQVALCHFCWLTMGAKGAPGSNPRSPTSTLIFPAFELVWSRWEACRRRLW